MYSSLAGSGWSMSACLVAVSVSPADTKVVSTWKTACWRAGLGKPGARSGGVFA